MAANSKLVKCFFFIISGGWFNGLYFDFRGGGTFNNMPLTVTNFEFIVCFMFMYTYCHKCGVQRRHNPIDYLKRSPTSCRLLSQQQVVRDY